MNALTDNKPRKGRPAGSNSFVKIRLSDLSNLMGSNCVVPVSKVWLRENAISLDTEAKPSTVSLAPAKETDALPPVEYTLTSFED